MRRDPFWGRSQDAAGAEPEAAAPLAWTALDVPVATGPTSWAGLSSDWQMRLRGGLYWFAVLSARRAVPGRRCRPERSKQLLTGRAGPGPGPGRTEGPARSPGPAANQALGTMGLRP